MKGITQDRLTPSTRPERGILDEIRNDHDLISRLKITHQELEALAKCALLGTLTCKQDMLFILRQIREAGRVDHATRVVPSPTLEEREDDLAPRVSRIPVSADAVALHHKLTYDRETRNGKLGLLFWLAVLVAGLAWNAFYAVSHWQNSYLSNLLTPSIGSSDALSGIDRFSVLLLIELLFVGGIASLVYLKTRKGNRRLKVRPAARSTR